MCTTSSVIVFLFYVNVVGHIDINVSVEREHAMVIRLRKSAPSLGEQVYDPPSN